MCVNIEVRGFYQTWVDYVYNSYHLYFTLYFSQEQESIKATIVRKGHISALVVQDTQVQNSGQLGEGGWAA